MALGAEWQPVEHLIYQGMAFIEGEISNKYGWGNIVNNALKILRIPYRVSRTDRYDCSSLVTRYLEEIGVDLGDLGEEPDSVCRSARSASAVRRGRPRVYAERLFLKAVVVMVLRHLPTVHALVT